MAYAAWRVSVQLTASNMTGSAFSGFINHTNTANSNMLKLQGHLANFRSAAVGGFKAASGALEGFVAHGLDAAGKFQQEMTTVFNTLHASAAQQSRLNALAIDVSGQTRQDPTTIAQEIAAAGQAGLTTDQILQNFKLYAKYADLQMVGPAHEDPIHALKTAIQIGHLEGAYQPQDVNKMVERLNKLGYTQPEDMEKVLTQGKYFIPTARALGMSIDETMDLTAMMGQNGLLRGRGGTGIANVINGLEKGPGELTTRRGLERMAGLTGLHIVDKNGKDNFIDKGGHIEMRQLIADLSEMAKRENNPSLFYKQLAASFSQSALPFLMSVTNPATQAQIKKTQERTRTMGSIDSMFDARQGNYGQQIATLKTNFDLLVVSTFTPVLKVITPAIASLANEVRIAATYLTAHPHLGLAVGVGMITAVGVAMAGTAVLSVASLWNLIASINALSAASGKSTASNLAGAFFGAFNLRGMGGILSAIFNPFNLFGKIGSLAKIGLSALEAAFLPGVRMAFSHIGLVAGNMGSSMFGVLGRFMLTLGVDIANVLPWVARIASGLGGFGLRMIPVVGWVALAVQALMYFHQHPAEIGKWVGAFVGYIRFHLIPDSIHAIQNGASMIVNAFKSIISGIINVFHPSNGKNVFQMLGDDVNTFKASFKQSMDAQDPKNANGAKGNKTTVVHKHEVSLRMDKKQVARMVIDHVSGRSGHDVRAGAGSVTSPRTSDASFPGNYHD